MSQRITSQAHAPELSLSGFTTQLTVTSWLYTNVEAGFHGMFEIVYNGGFFLWYQENTGGASNEHQLTANGSTFSGSNNTNLISTGWHYQALVIDGSTWRAYLDGVEVFNTTMVAPTSMTVIRFGESENFGNYLNGNVGAIKVWNTALTADQIELERQTYLPKRFTNLFAFHPVLVGSDRLFDYSGNGRNLTVTTAVDGEPPPVSYGLNSLFTHFEISNDIVVSPTGITSETLTDNPTTVLGSLTITPNQTEFFTQTNTPDIVLGSIAYTPNTVNLELENNLPTVILGSISNQPTNIIVELETSNTTVVLGSINLANLNNLLEVETNTLDLILGSITVEPTINLAVENNAPNVSTGGLFIEPMAAFVEFETINPNIVLGSAALIPTQSNVALSANNPLIIYGSLAINPSQIQLELLNNLPIVDVPSSTITPNDNFIETAINLPSVILSNLTITPLTNRAVLANSLNFQNDLKGTLTLTLSKSFDNTLQISKSDNNILTQSKNFTNNLRIN